MNDAIFESTTELDEIEHSSDVKRKFYFRHSIQTSWRNKMQMVIELFYYHCFTWFCVTDIVDG